MRRQALSLQSYGNFPEVELRPMGIWFICAREGWRGKNNVAVETSCLHWHVVHLRAAMGGEVGTGRCNRTGNFPVRLQSLPGNSRYDRGIPGTFSLQQSAPHSPHSASDCVAFPRALRQTAADCARLRRISPHSAADCVTFPPHSVADCCCPLSLCFL